jgi:hypothetical protein
VPYIKQDKRDPFDPIIDQLHNELVNAECDDDSNNTEGNLNYIITRLLMKVYSSPSYREINDAIGMLESCKLEYYRKVAVPYEENKSYENGEVIPNAIQRETDSLS